MRVARGGSGAGVRPTLCTLRPPLHPLCPLLFPLLPRPSVISHAKARLEARRAEARSRVLGQMARMRSEAQRGHEHLEQAKQEHADGSVRVRVWERGGGQGGTFGLTAAGSVTVTLNRQSIIRGSCRGGFPRLIHSMMHNMMHNMPWCLPASHIITHTGPHPKRHRRYINGSRGGVGLYMCRHPVGEATAWRRRRQRR